MKKMKTKNFFRTVGRVILPVIFVGFCQTVLAQNPVPTTQLMPDTAKMTYNQISQTAKLYVFPAKGQSKNQQKKDEFECYKWAMEQSGVDPMSTTKTEAAPKQEGPTGAGVTGAAKGALVGTAIGSVSGDAGKGAAYGAIAGGVAGRECRLASQSPVAR